MDRTSVVNTSGLNDAKVLAALYNAAKPPRRMGALQYGSGPKVMDEAWAQSLIDSGKAFSQLHCSERFVDYVHGQAIKVDLADAESFDARDFDEYNGGVGTAQSAISYLRRTGAVIITPDCDARTWLRTVTAESLKRFDEGDRMGAIVNFLVDTTRHPGTAHIPDLNFTNIFLVEGAKEGRDEFEKVMIAFSV